MQAEKVMLKTDGEGKLHGLPLLPVYREVEAIFLLLSNNESQTECRQPHPDIVGKIMFQGDIMNTISEKDWNLPQ